MTISIGTVGVQNVPDNGSASGTTGAVNTTGATLLVGISLQKAGTTPLTPSDSAGNTWLPIGSTVIVPGTTTMLDRWLVAAPITSASHTFTVTNSSGSSRFILALYPV